MLSVKSCFNPTLFRKNLARFWPIWALYGAVWLFGLPVSLLLAAGERQPDSLFYFSTRAVHELTAALTVPMSAFFGLIAAMAVFSYLYSARSVGAIHALPLRREALFLTNYLSGLTFFAAPNAVILAVTLLGEAAAGCFRPLPLCLWFLAQLFGMLFFYSFAVFCAMFTGHILALPAFYAVLNVLATVLCFLLTSLMDVFLYGFVSSPALEQAAIWLTPAYRMNEALYVRSGALQDSYTLYGLHILLFYAAVGVVLTVPALIAYRRRRAETAGDLVAVGWVRPVFKYGFAACCAMVFGSLLYSIFSAALPDGSLSLVIFMAICGAAGYFAAAMLLQKSFRVLRQWKGCAVFLACLIAASAALSLDVTGFVARVPDPDTVASAEVYGMGSAPHDTADYASVTVTDPEDLAVLAQLHRAFTGTRGAAGETDWDATLSLRVTYTLKNGSTLSRYYPYVPVREEDLTDPASPAALAEAFLNRLAVVRSAYRLDEVSPMNLLSMSVDLYDPDTRSLAGTDLELDGGAELRGLWQAVLEDFEAGALGRRYVFSESAPRLENCYINDLHVTYLLPVEDGPKDNFYSSEITVTLTPQASRTMAVLEKLGYPADTCFITHADLQDRGEEAVRVYSEREEIYAYSMEDADLPATEAVPVYTETVTP